MERLGDYEWLVLTSPAGVEALWRWLEAHGKDARALGRVKLAAIGPGTDGELNRHGLKADYVPEVYDAAHLGAIGFDDMATYCTVYENPRSQELRELVEGEDLTLVTFTSASTVKGFVSSVGEDADFSHMVGMCIGAQTAAQAKAFGIPVRVAGKATIDALVNLIVEGV